MARMSRFRIDGCFVVGNVPLSSSQDIIGRHYYKFFPFHPVSIHVVSVSITELLPFSFKKIIITLFYVFIIYCIFN